MFGTKVVNGRCGEKDKKNAPARWAWGRGNVGKFFLL
nr:MAG TPA_asm: hypothetical protein [Caudoviricetes sp.]